MGSWRGTAPRFYPSAACTAQDRDAISEIIPRLYLTNYRGAENGQALRSLGVTHVASVGDEFTEDGALAGIKYWRCNITDDESQRDAMGAALGDGAAFIHEALSTRKGTVIVHCAAGISRSTTVALAYLILHRNMTLLRALETVYAARRCVWPNDGFMAALIALEQRVYGKHTIDLDEYVRWGDYDGPADDDAAEGRSIQKRLSDSIEAAAEARSSRESFRHPTSP